MCRGAPLSALFEADQKVQVPRLIHQGIDRFRLIMSGALVYPPDGSVERRSFSLIGGFERVH
jgi:hypothetical protein